MELISIVGEEEADIVVVRAEEIDVVVAPIIAEAAQHRIGDLSFVTERLPIESTGGILGQDLDLPRFCEYPRRLVEPQVRMAPETRRELLEV